MAVDKNKRVLVVDDSEDNLLLMELLLRSEGYTVDSASSGIEGLKKVYKRHPDLIILDLMMPGISGLEVIQRLKSKCHLSSIPIILLTANSSLKSTDIEDVDAVCLKPFDLNHILQKIKTLIMVESSNLVSPLQEIFTNKHLNF